MSNSLDRSENYQIVNFFAKHIVALVVKVVKNGLRSETILTTFVLEVKERWFLVTSAHGIRNIEEVLHLGYEIESVFLIDSLTDDATDHHIVPFSFSLTKPSRLDKFDKEFDVSIIPLPHYYIELLKSNAVQSLNELSWKDIPSSVDACWMFGLPTEFIRNSDSQYSLTPLGLQVFLDVKKPMGSESRKYPRYYGRIETEDIVDSIEGMSGGPIIAIYDKRYWVIAVQSSWWPNSKIIEAIPIRFLGEAIEQYYTDLQSAASS